MSDQIPTDAKVISEHKVQKIFPIIGTVGVDFTTYAEGSLATIDPNSEPLWCQVAALGLFKVSKSFELKKTSTTDLDLGKIGAVAIKMHVEITDWNWDATARHLAFNVRVRLTEKFAIVTGPLLQVALIPVSILLHDA